MVLTILRGKMEIMNDPPTNKDIAEYKLQQLIDLGNIPQINLHETDNPNFGF